MIILLPMLNWLSKTLSSNSSSATSGSSRGWGLAAGVALAGGVLAARALGRARQHTLPHPHLTPPALDAEVRTLELIEGTTRYYERPGSGTPVVLLHSFNAAASSFEMKPIFEHLAATTDRPLYALDWLGFGLSDRPDITYRPELFQRQLRRFLSERCPSAPDIIALSLSAEYAATVAVATPFLANRLVLISPTGLSASTPASLLRRLTVNMSAEAGAFDSFFYRLATPSSMRHFYEKQIFLRPQDVPDSLVDYAHASAQVRGGHYAPRYFINGSLFLNDTARHAYERLPCPTLMVVPASPGSTIQRFDHLDEVISKNKKYLSVERLQGGLLPHWDAPDAFFETLDNFLSSQ